MKRTSRGWKSLLDAGHLQMTNPLEASSPFTETMTSPTDPDAGRALPPLALPPDGLPAFEMPDLTDDPEANMRLMYAAIYAYALASCAERDAEIEAWEQKYLRVLSERDTKSIQLAQRDERIVELEARRKTDPVERLHNICDALNEQLDESPYDEKAWELADADNRQLRQRAEAAEARVRELEDLANKALQEFQVLHSERDALRARLDSAPAAEPVAHADHGILNWLA